MLDVVEFPGAEDGMARYVPQHELADSEAWTMFDILLNVPGYTRRRGPLDESTATSHSGRGVGITRTQAPDGTEVVVELVRTATPNGRVKGAINSTMDFAWPHTPGHSPYEIFDAKDALGGGVLIGTQTEHGSNPTNTALGLWRGAAKDTTAAKTLSVAIAVGDMSVTLAAGGSDFGAGHFLFSDNDQLVGVVRSVAGEVLTLEKRALIAVDTGTTVYGTPIRGINPRVSAGRITTATASTTVNGGSTKFRAQGLGSGTWDLYDPNFAYIGTVSAVTADAQLELTGNAAIALLNSDYLAIKRDGSYALASPVVGALNEQYGGHQFYAKGNVLSFSDDDDPEALDQTSNGNSVVFSADDLRSLTASEQGLIAITEKEAHILIGGPGTTPSRWRGERIHDDGVLSAGAAIPYQGGVIWAGRRGVWYWNGGEPVNIASRLGDDWRSFVKDSSRASTMIVRDHLFLHVPSGASGVFAKVKDATTTNYTALTFVVNLKTGAITLAANLAFQGAIEAPASLALGTSLFLITTSAPDARVMKGDTLFDDSGTDEYAVEGGAVGPDFYLETKKYDLGAGQRLKLFKMLLLHYLSAGAAVKLDTVPGLATTGSLSTSDYAATASFLAKRIKFMKRSQYLGFRLYQASSAATRVTLGTWAIGFKWKRPGRV